VVGAVSIGSFELSGWRLRRTRWAMAINPSAAAMITHFTLPVLACDQHCGTTIRREIRGSGRQFARKLQPNDAGEFAGLIVLDVVIAARHQPEISRRRTRFERGFPGVIGDAHRRGHLVNAPGDRYRDRTVA
jgi:hypothetical protein